MQAVAKFMKQRDRIIPGNKYGRAGFATFDKVGVVRNDGADWRIDLRELFLRPVFGHPGPGSFAGARIRVKVEQPDQRVTGCGFAIDFIGGHIGVIHRCRFGRREGQSIQLLRHPKHRIAQLVEL